MENPSWYFVIASIIAVIGIVVAFKQFAAKLEERLNSKDSFPQQEIQRDLTQFFLKVAGIETIPVILIVLGFMGVKTWNGETTDLLLPFVMVIGTFLLGIIQILLTRGTLHSLNVSAEVKSFFNTYVFIGLSLISAFPIISVVALLIMMG